MGKCASDAAQAAGAAEKGASGLFRLRGPVLVPFVVAMSLLLGLFVFGIHRVLESSTREFSQRRFESFRSLWETALEREAGLMEEALMKLAAKPALVEAFTLRSVDSLLEAAAPDFVRLRQNYHVTHFYVMDPSLRVFLRVHRPKLSGDVITHWTARQAQTTLRTARGVELGPMGTLTLRVVIPWIHAGRLMGFLELGKEVGTILKSIHQATGLHLAAFVEKEHLDRDLWSEGQKVLNRPDTWTAFRTVVLSDTTLSPVPEPLVPYIDEENHQAGQTDIRFGWAGRTYRSRFFHLKDASGKSIGDIAVLTDITDRVAHARRMLIGFGTAAFLLCSSLVLFMAGYLGRVESMVRRTHQQIMDLERGRSCFILQEMPALVALLTPSGTFETWSTWAQKTFGFDPEEAVGILRPDDLLEDRNLAEELRREAACSAYASTECWGRTRDGRRLWLRVTLVTIPVTGETLYILEDETAQREAEDRLQAQYAFLQTLLGTIPNPIYYTDARGRPAGCNAAFLKFFGIQEAVEPGGALTHLEKAAVFLSWLERDRKLLESGHMHVEEQEILDREGRPRSVIFNRAVFRLKDGTVGGVVGILTDITERRKAEEQRILLATAVDQTADVVILTDRDGRIEYVNPAFEKVSGYTREEALGRAPWDLPGLGMEEATRYEIRDAVLSGRVWTGRVRTASRDGAPTQLEGKVSAIRDGRGRLTHYVAVYRDVTEKTRLEDQLRQAQKMEAIGTLAGGIAHDFNNILLSINGYTELLLQRLPPDDPGRRYAERVLQGGQRAKDLVAQILTFSRQGDRHPKPLELSTIVKEAAKLLRASIPTTIDIRCTIRAERAVVLADPTQMHQVLMNLCTNSAHAMGSKPGLLEIVLDEVLVGGEGIPCPPGVSSGPYVRLQVRDTGCGIPESIRHKIFDPYFTTKKPGQGTGLGLAVVHGIVKDHGGFIQVESETGKGTAVRVFIPAVAEPATAEPPTSESPLPRGTGRILLVDDEESVVTLGREMLQKVGYRVETDTDPRAALERIRSAPHAFDLVITDLTMPHMTGVDLAEEAARIRSDLPVVLCTGYHEASQTLKPNGNIRAVLSKPFLTKDLAEAVAQAVQSPPASNTAQ